MHLVIEQLRIILLLCHSLKLGIGRAKLGLSQLSSGSAGTSLSRFCEPKFLAVPELSSLAVKNSALDVSFCARFFSARSVPRGTKMPVACNGKVRKLVANWRLTTSNQYSTGFHVMSPRSCTDESRICTVARCPRFVSFRPPDCLINWYFLPGTKPRKENRPSTPVIWLW